jgi:hypothetical protein
LAIQSDEAVDRFLQASAAHLFGATHGARLQTAFARRAQRVAIVQPPESSIKSELSHRRNVRSLDFVPIPAGKA